MVTSADMPKLTIENVGEFEIAPGKRLINAIIDDAAANQHYSCGGIAKCTTCRVVIITGEPEQITQAEKDLAIANGLDKMPGVRLSCQLNCDHDMSIQIISPKPPTKNPNHPKDQIEPPPVWVKK